MMEADAASPNGPNDVDLLWNHLGMTAAGQKGVRVTKNIIEDAVKAAVPLASSGEWTGTSWPTARFLSPQQRRQFVELAKRRTEQATTQAGRNPPGIWGGQQIDAPAAEKQEDIPGFIPSH